jgi:hypothetical protein
MDIDKCRAIKAELASEPEPRVVPIDRFFDGNDDEGSIGCNLDPHPGIDQFRHVLTDLLARRGVLAIYARISELDPGEDFWPYSDTVLVVGTLSVPDLRDAVSELQPDEVGEATEGVLPPSVAKLHAPPVWVIWWD